MTNGLAAARAVWSRRSSSRHHDRAFVAYSIALTGLVVAAPLVRLAWLFLVSGEITHLLQLPEASLLSGVVVCATWAVALTLGATRGPALVPPFLAFAWASSRFSGRAIFGRSVGVLTALIGLVAGAGFATLAASLVSIGFAVTADVVRFGACGIAAGVVASALWLVGQCWPRQAPVAAIVLMGAGAMGLVSPAARSILPWTWAVSSYPGAAPYWQFYAALVLALALGSAIPALLNRLDGTTLEVQSARWELTVAHTLTLDLHSASSTLQVGPRRGRRLRATVASRHLVVVFFVRSIVGASRTPGRLVRGVALLVASGAALVLASDAPLFGPGLAAAAGVIAYLGLGAFTGGLYHAAHVAADLPVYGIRDSRLFALQIGFPACASVVAALIGAALATWEWDDGGTGGLWSAPVVALLALGARGSDSLRGPSPTFLLTSAPSVMGDPIPALRLLWAIDAPVFAALAGLAVTSPSPVALVVISMIIAMTCALRWVRRD